MLGVIGDSLSITLSEMLRGAVVNVCLSVMIEARGKFRYFKGSFDLQVKLVGHGYCKCLNAVSVTILT